MASVFYDNGQTRLLHGHVMAALRMLPDESIQAVITSPPYWALRAYGTDAQVWGGDPEHEHIWTDQSVKGMTGGNAKVTLNGGHEWQDSTMFRGGTVSTCECGAWRGELGHEPTPAMFVAHLVEIFREVWRVLRSDGVCFVNLGDSYAGSGKGPRSANGLTKQHSGVGSEIGPTPAPTGLKPKNLVLIPERFALAMQDDGWYVRSRIAWCKRAPMPESVRDRPTSAWEHIWMFSKSERYFWDQEAVRETATAISGGGWSEAYIGAQIDHGAIRLERPESNGTRNLWNYWLLSPDPEPLAHFATFPREIPRRCIAAATSEHGQCPRCGRPWERVTARQATGEKQKLPSGMATYAGDHGSIHRDGRELVPTYTKKTVSVTTGWQQACRCAPALPVPQTVLDPFIGSGTVCQVATSLGRRSIGIDLNETYLKAIASRKVAQMGLIPAMEE